MIDLNRYIRKFWSSAELTVFGSSGNGFAFRHSDLDISLTFKDQPTAENLNCIEVRQITGNYFTVQINLRRKLNSAAPHCVTIFISSLPADRDPGGQAEADDGDAERAGHHLGQGAHCQARPPPLTD